MQNISIQLQRTPYLLFYLSYMRTSQKSILDTQKLLITKQNANNESCIKRRRKNCGRNELK